MECEAGSSTLLYYISRSSGYQKMIDKELQISISEQQLKAFIEKVQGHDSLQEKLTAAADELNTCLLAAPSLTLHGYVVGAKQE